VIVTHLVTQPMTPCHLTWRWVLTLKGQCAGARLYRLGPTWTTAGVGDVDDRDDDPDQHVEITRVPSCGVVRSRRRRDAPPRAPRPPPARAGSRAGLCRGAARPAQAGPISPAPTSIATAQPSGCAWSRRTAMSSSAGAFSSAWSLCGCLTRFRSCLRVTGRSTRHDPLPPSTRANRARMEPLPAQSIMPPKAVRLTVPSLFGFLAAIG